MLTKPFKITLLIIILALLAAGGFVILQNRQISSQPVVASGGWEEAAKELNQQALNDLSAGKTASFTHPEFGFGFQYPKGFQVGQVPDDNGETILVQNDGSGFQVYVRALEGEIDITAEQVKADIPDMPVSKPFYIDIKGTKALVFDSETEGKEKTGEIWFARGGLLFQVTAPRALAPTLAEIIKSWVWNQ